MIKQYEDSILCYSKMAATLPEPRGTVERRRSWCWRSGCLLRPHLLRLSCCPWPPGAVGGARAAPGAPWARAPGDWVWRSAGPPPSRWGRAGSMWALQRMNNRLCSLHHRRRRRQKRRQRSSLLFGKWFNSMPHYRFSAKIIWGNGWIQEINGHLEEWMIFQLTPHQTITLPEWMFYCS